MRGDFRVGEWIVHSRLNALERDGLMVRLEPKGMQVLLLLASEPGEVFTRESLLGRVWPDVVVGDDVLVRAISKLRQAFKDEQVIQTVHKVGYRLTAPVDLAPTPAPNSTPVQNQEAGEAAASTAAAPPGFGTDQNADRATVLHRSSKLRILSRPVLSLAFIGIAAAVVLGFAVLISRSNHNVNAEAYITRPITTDPGSQIQSSFSPDGKSIAYVWLRPGKPYRQVYIRSLASWDPVKLTSDEPADQFDPVWSPNGRLIAFVRKDSTHTSIILVNSSGGSEREVYTLPVNSAREYGGLAWSADGENVIFPQQDTLEAPSYLVELSLRNGTIRSITSPPSLWDGDFWPEISPDGSELAFIRGSELLVRDIYVMKLPDGPVRRVTHDCMVMSFAWFDDSTIIFSATRNGTLSLWRVKTRGSDPQRVAAAGDDAYGPAVSLHAHKLVFSHGSALWGIFAADLAGSGHPTPKMLLTSSEEVTAPAISPAGNRIAFQSWGSGSREIWTALMDGSNPTQLTNRVGQSPGRPKWSPNGRRIAFDLRADSFAHIYIMDADGGNQRAVTGDNYNDVDPSWSPDGHWLYFGSNRSGSWQIWKAAVDGNHAPQQITTNGGILSMVSSDGHWLYFSKYSIPGVWRQSLSGGPAQKVVDEQIIENCWTISRGTVYALASQNGQLTLRQIDPETGRTHVVTLFLNDAPEGGLSISPNRDQIVFPALISASSHLTLVDNFR